MDNYIFKKDAALTKEESNNCIKYFYLNKNTQKDTTRGYFYFHPAPSLEWPEFKFLENLRKTVFLEVTDDLRLKRFNYLPSYLKNDFSDKEFFHFHFLFHSVSLIIPKKGKVLPIRNLSPDFFDGNNYFDESNLNKKKKDKKLVIDLFSLIS